MAEVLTLLHNAEAARSPAANAWKLLFTATTGTALTIDVANGEASDALIDIAVMNPTDGAAYVDGDAPPSYSLVAKKIKVEADGTEGSIWAMPVKNVATGSKIAVRTNLVGVTFCCHGIAFT